MTRKGELTSPDTEKVLIGAALEDPDNFRLEVLPADFSNAELARIWQVGRELAQTGEDFDMQAVSDELERRGMAHAFAKLAKLVTSGGVGAPAARRHAKEVRDLADRRRVEAQLQRAVNVLHKSNGTWRDELAELTAGVNAVATVQEATPERKTSWTMAELLAAKFDPVRWVIPGLLPAGLSFLGGRPKVGKSILVTQLCVAVGSGGRIFDNTVQRGRACYIALEDHPESVQERVMAQYAPAGCDFMLQETWPFFTQGGAQKLMNMIEAEGFTLTVLDTWQRIAGHVDPNDPVLITEMLGPLQRFALQRNVSILINDHHPKGPPGGGDNDPVDDVIGTTAKAGVSDALLGLYRKRDAASDGGNYCTLKARGRRLKDVNLALKLDPDTLSWQLTEAANLLPLGRKGDVLKIFMADPDKTWTLTELEQETGIAKGNVKPLLDKLVEDGEIVRLERDGVRIPYRLHVDDADPEE